MTLVSKSNAKSREKSRFARGIGAASCAVTVLFLASGARAEDAETRTAARDLATQGAQAFDAGQYEQASDFFLRAYELVHAPSISLMRARSLAKLGQLLEAIDIYEQTARVKLPADAPEAYTNAVDAARSEVEDVRRRLPRLKLTLTHTDASEKPQVTIDGKPTPAALLGVERPMDPGLHRISVLVSGQQRATRELTLDDGRSYELELSAGPENGAKAQDHAVKAGDLSARPGSPGSSLRTFGYVSVGVGIVGLGLGTYTGLVALHHQSALDAVCHPSCPQSSASDLDGFRSNRTLSWLSYGLGVAAGATGILLLTLGRPEREHVALDVLPGGIRLRGRL